MPFRTIFISSASQDFDFRHYWLPAFIAIVTPLLPWLLAITPLATSRSFRRFHWSIRSLFFALIFISQIRFAERHCCRRRQLSLSHFCHTLLSGFRYFVRYYADSHYASCRFTRHIQLFAWLSSRCAAGWLASDDIFTLHFHFAQNVAYWYAFCRFRLPLDFFTLASVFAGRWFRFCRWCWLFSYGRQLSPGFSRFLRFSLHRIVDYWSIIATLAIFANSFAD